MKLSTVLDETKKYIQGMDELNDSDILNSDRIMKVGFTRVSEKKAIENLNKIKETFRLKNILIQPSGNIFAAGKFEALKQTEIAIKTLKMMNLL